MLTRKRLEALLEEALVDCYNQSEEVGALCAMIDDNLALPFRTPVLGLEVDVVKVEFNDAGEIVALCRRGASQQRVPVVDLPMPDPPPKGWEWIEAYRYWGRGRR